MLRTIAKRGRSMKKCARRMFFTSSCRLHARRSDRAVLSRDLGSSSGVEQSVDNHSVIRRESRPNHSQTALKVPNFDLFRYYRPVRRNRQDGMLGLVRLYNRIRHQERWRRSRDHQLHTSELARHQRKLGFATVVRAWMRAARPVEDVVEEIEGSFLGVALVFADGKRDVMDMRALHPPTVFRIEQKIGLAHIEVEIDWID